MQKKEERKQNAAESLKAANREKKYNRPIGVNDTVRIKGLTSIGKVELIDNKQAVVIFGDMRTKDGYCTTGTCRRRHAERKPKNSLQHTTIADKPVKP